MFAVGTLTSAGTAGQTSLFFHDPEFRPEMTIFKASGGRLSGQIFIELFRRPISSLWITSYADAMTGKLVHGLIAVIHDTPNSTSTY